MCPYHGNRNHYSENSSSSSSSLPRILQALIRMRRNAENDYYIIQSRLEQIKEMEIIINKLIATHIDSDNYVDYLFKRAEQLSAHLETYENIIGKIDIGNNIRKNFKSISFEFIEYLKRKIEFKSVWIEGMQTIEMGRQIITEKIMKLNDFQQTIDDVYENREYFRLSDYRTEFDNEFEEN
ncbi:hypothetical protein BLA29_000067 [Euroglyphus maynei]|uniref:Uncharacterized protein n=1 Tax=Euroglyphus maynei TaxID=6958 RepID=A0A1Y3AYK8_EURMA|nr:hypothetical protein BLA29_000067 [Euroglyphus maynei]